MRKIKLFLSLLMVMLLSVGNVWAATTLEKATSIAANDVVVFVCEGVSKELTSISSTSTPYGIGTEYTTLPAGTWKFTVEAGNSTGTFAFKSDDKYLSWSSGNSLTTSTTKNNNSSWTVVFTDGHATITNVNTTNRVIWWNVGSPRFACYTSKSDGKDYKYTQIYKEVTSGGGDTPSKTDVTDEQLAWSASQAEVTIGAENSFPSLTNSLDLDVTYQSTATAVATIAANGDITLVKAGSTIIKAVFAGDDDYNAKTVSYDLTVNPAPLAPIPGAVVDELTRATTGVTGTSYTAWSGKTATSEAVYAGGSAGGNDAIQLRQDNTKKDAGIYTTTSGGKVKRVAVVWNSNTQSGRTLNVYGKNTAYEALTDLYDSQKQGTLLGTIVNGTSTYLDIEEDYQHIGLRATAAMYLDKVSISWIPATKYAVNIASVENGALAVKDGDDAITSGAEFTEGKTLTVVATPNEGYKLDGIKVIETGSNPENVVTNTVLSGTTLTVPAYAVTVSAEFSANEAPFATLTLSEIGEETVYYDDDSKREGDIVSLPLTAASCSKVFVGWDPDENCATEPTYAPGANFTLGASASNKLYAVYATPTVDTESEPVLAQTLQYDTWTYSGSTSDRSSYRLFGNGAYVESAEFDLSTLAKVKVFGGTYGGQDTYKTGTIGDGSQKWKDITMTGTGNAKEHAFTDGTALSGTGKLYVTSTCGNGADGSNGNGLRISKVEIYTYGTTYGEYSTECMAKVDAPTFPVEQKEYTAAQNITISAVNGATIHYTTDGSTPTNQSATYSEPIALSTRGEYTIKAIAIKNGFATSDVAVAHYSINLPFANLADLVDANLADGSEVIVSFADEVITYKGSKYISLTTKDANDNTIQIYHSSAAMPDWVVGGKVSATAKRFTWTLFNNTQWELVPVGEFAWATDLAYTAPKTVSSVVVSGAPTQKVYTLGETFDPAGLTVTVNYSDETQDINPAVGVTFTTDPANGKMALEQTSIKVKATYNNVTSEEWFTVNGLTVNDLETKTIAEFIAAEGGRCYLIGTVSNIANTTYGNFDLTDASGSIYVYGCLDAEGASKNFASLDVVEDDYIKVIADVYEYYNNETHEAKNVQFVEELEKPEIPVASVSVADATVKIGKKVQLTATVLPINASNKSVTWSVVSGDTFAEVDATGLVTGLAEGEATIRATSVADGTKYGECTITVTGGINFGAGDFVLVEDAAELTEGTFVIVAAAGEYNAAMKYYAGSDNNHKAKAAIKEGKYLHYDSEFGVYEIKNYVVAEEVVGISFYNDDAENYFALPASSNQLKVSADQNNNSSWIVAVNDGVTTLTNKAFTGRTLRYNSSSSCFASYESGQKPIALYKYVTPAAYRVYYNDNVAEEEIEVPAYQSVNGENKVTISTVEPVRDGYLFGGWKDGEANVYEAGVEYTLSGDITLYAQWTTATVSTLSYNPNGGTLIGGETAIADADVAEGTNLTIAANVYEKGDNFVFAGWQLGDDVYQQGDPFVMPATDVEFVAKWDAVEVSDYALVTDLAQLQAGDKIIIVAANLDFAAGAQAGTYRESVAIGKTASKNNLVLAGYAAPTEFTLGISDGKFSFNDGTGYMYEEDAKKVKNQADPYYWTISIDGDAIATISATNELRYNSSSPRFTTYESGQQSLQLYRKPGDAPTPDYETVRSGLEINRYYTVCLPKKVTAIKGASFWTLNNKSQDGTTAYLEEETNNLPFAAGTPFIIQATAENLEVVYEGDATNVAGTNGALHGTLVYMDAAALAAAGSDVYMLFSNELRPVGENNHLDANRAYVLLSGLTAVNEAPNAAPGKRVRAMPMQTQVATGIDALNASDAPVKVLINGQLFIIRGEKMFDAKGQLVK